MNSNLSKHSIVLNLRFPQWGAIIWDQNQLPYEILFHFPSEPKFKNPIFSTKSKHFLQSRNFTLRAPESLENSFVTESVFSTLHHQSQPVIDALMGLLLQIFHFFCITFEPKKLNLKIQNSKTDRESGKGLKEVAKLPSFCRWWPWWMLSGVAEACGGSLCRDRGKGEGFWYIG